MTIPGHVDGWDLSGDPSLRAALVDMLADALVADVDRADAARARPRGDLPVAAGVAVAGADLPARPPRRRRAVPIAPTSAAKG